MNEVLLGFEHLQGSHTGRAMAGVLKRVLDFHEITKDQIMTITSDNASPNDKLVTELKKALSIIDKEIGDVNRVPCLAHVIQLAVKSLVEHMKIKPKNNKAITEWHDEEKEREGHTDARQNDGVPWTLKLVSVSFDCTTHCINQVLRYGISQSMSMLVQNARNNS